MNIAPFLYSVLCSSFVILRTTNTSAFKYQTLLMLTCKSSAGSLELWKLLTALTVDSSLKLLTSHCECSICVGSNVVWFLVLSIVLCCYKCSGLILFQQKSIL